MPNCFNIFMGMYLISMQTCDGLGVIQLGRLFQLCIETNTNEINIAAWVVEKTILTIT